MQFSGMNFSARGARGQAADREASSCNAAQLPRFLVELISLSLTVETL